MAFASACEVCRQHRLCPECERGARPPHTGARDLTALCPEKSLKPSVHQTELENKANSSHDGTAHGCLRSLINSHTTLVWTLRDAIIFGRKATGEAIVLTRYQRS